MDEDQGCSTSRLILRFSIGSSTPLNIYMKLNERIAICQTSRILDQYLEIICLKFIPWDEGKRKEMLTFKYLSLIVGYKVKD